MIVIKNGQIVDGKKTKAYVGDVLIKDKRIVEMGNIPITSHMRVIDAFGKVVCPGFIDTHSHSDLYILENPYNEIKIKQGITTEILGQDGISMAPLPPAYIESWRKNIAGLDGESDTLDWNYETTKGYLKKMESRGVGLNEAYLVPHGNIRMEAMGLSNRFATGEEIERMCEITKREMEAGAIGLSTGLIYIPCAYAQMDELIAMCKIVAKFDGVFVVHQRSEADTILESMDEILEIARQSGVKTHFSHFKVCGKKNWKYIPDMLKKLDDAASEGLQISFDQYPYAAGSTMLSVILPPWAHSGGTDDLLKRLKDRNMRDKMKNDIENGIIGWDNFIDFAGYDQIYITSVKTKQNEQFVGKSLKEMAEEKNQDPFEASCDLLLEEENSVGMVDFYGLEEHVLKFLVRPEQNVCTDGLLAGKPHPRAFGSFPRILRKYVREQNILSLEDAIYKMTGKAAKAMNIKERGTLEVGNYADIVIFDPQKISDCGDYVDPIHFPIGISHVIINGIPVMEQSNYEKKLAGKVLRR